MEYAFLGVDNDLVLSIHAKSVRIFEVGENADINSALFDVGYEYIGDQISESSVLTLGMGGYDKCPF